VIGRTAADHHTTWVYKPEVAHTV